MPNEQDETTAVRDEQSVSVGTPPFLFVPQMNPCGTIAFNRDATDKLTVVLNGVVVS